MRLLSATINFIFLPLLNLFVAVVGPPNLRVTASHPRAGCRHLSRDRYCFQLMDPFLAYQSAPSIKEGENTIPFLVHRSLLEAIDVMTTKFIAVVTMCCSFLLIFQSIFATTTALRRAGRDKFMIRDKNIPKRQNYQEESILDNEIFENIDEKGPSYNSKSFDPEESEDLPSFMVDYANMIRNDFILLDNSVETRTRKRGNIKVKKQNQAMPNIPCNCEINSETIDLGESTIPRYIENRTCSQSKCAPLYVCNPTFSNLTLLRKRKLSSKRGYTTQSDLHSDFRNRWYTEDTPVIIACVCISEYRLPSKLV